MSYKKRDRSYSPGSRRRSDERPRNGSGDGGGRRYSGGRENPRDTTRRTLKQIISQSADSKNWRASEPVEERSVALCRILTSRGYLDDAHDTADVAALMVQAAGAFSMHTSVYAVATGLCVVEGRPTKPSSSQQDSDRDDDEPPKDDMVADDANVSHDPGRNFGRLVVDGCCNALANALHTVLELWCCQSERGSSTELLIPIAQGGFLRAKLLLRFLGELVNCGLVQAQEYGDLLVTLCSGYVSTESQNVCQPCRDIVADMVLSGVLRAGPALSKAWIGGFSDLMDDIRTFMAARHAPFRLKGLRAMLVTPDGDLDEEQQNNNGDAAAEDRHGVQGTEPMEDSLAILWDVVSALHDSGWHEEDLPQSIPRLWKKPVVEEKLVNLSSLSLPEEVVAADTIPMELTRMGACELAACSGMTDDGTASPADRPDWSYALSIMGDRDLFDEDDGAGPASCSSKVLPKKERFVLMEYCKDILACFQPRCRLDGSKVGKWSMLVDQLFSIGEVAPKDCQPAYLITGVLFLSMLQVPPAEHLAISCHRTLLELCRAVPKEVPAAVCYCTGRLFDELERLDTAVASRFAAWFADHLKNTEYKWPFWKHWCNVVELQPDNAQRVFVSNVLAELVKLSYTERIKKTLPEALWALLPLDPTPVCLYLDHPDAVSKSLQSIAVDMASRITAQHEARKLQAWLDGDHDLTDEKTRDVKDTSDKAEDAGEDAAEPAADPASSPVDPAWRSNMLIQILLRAGQASPTHTFGYLDRYREYLRALCRDKEAGEANQIAMLDGTAQLWQNSSQWFCLVCRYLLEIGVILPTTVIHYFFRDDNNNAIAVSPFLWEVMSRAIGICVDDVNLALNTLEQIEEEEKALGPRPSRKSDTNDDPNEDDMSRFDPDEARRQRLSDKVRDQIYNVRHALQEARALCSITCAGFTRAIANALPQYEANGIGDFTSDPWWVTMTSYFKASLWLFAAAPHVPERCLPLREEDPTGGNQVVLDVNALDALASNAGCKEHVEGIVADLTDVRRV